MVMSHVSVVSVSRFVLFVLWKEVDGLELIYMCQPAPRIFYVRHATVCWCRHTHTHTLTTVPSTNVCVLLQSSLICSMIV